MCSPPPAAARADLAAAADLRMVQLAHPEALTPELIEATAAWTTVVTAIAQHLQDATALLQGQPMPVCFVDRCDAEPELRRQLEQLCTQQLHGLLMKWLVTSVQERLAVHAVPQFWQHYRELAGGHYPLVGVAQQRRCLASAFTATARLHAYMSAQLRLVRLLDLKSWRPHSGGETSACGCSSSDLASSGGGGGSSGGSGGSGGGSPMMGDEPVDEAGGPSESPAAAGLLTVLGALLQGAAPDTQAFATWMTNCWERAFLDTTRAERSAAWAWQEGDPEADGEAESIQAVADEEDEEGAPAVPELRRQMRAFCAQLCALRWLPLVEPSLSVTLHAQLRQMLTARCARSFESRQLSRLLGWLGSVAMPWLRLVLHPEAAEGAADSAALQHWHARLRFATMQSLASLRIGERVDLQPACSPMRPSLQPHASQPAAPCFQPAAPRVPACSPTRAPRRALRPGGRLARLAARAGRPYGVPAAHARALAPRGATARAGLAAAAQAGRRHVQHHPGVRVHDPRAAACRPERRAARGHLGADARLPQGATLGG